MNMRMSTIGDFVHHNNEFSRYDRKDNILLMYNSKIIRIW